MTRIICISDTHNRHNDINVPDGDILIHAGDMSGRGRADEIARFAGWFAKQPHPHKVCIAGNHDFLFEREPALARTIILRDEVIYLEDRGIDLCGLRIWGTPWTPEFYNWAFNGIRDEDTPFKRGPALTPIYDQIHHQANVLVCHGPPYGILDLCESDPFDRDLHQGSKELLRRCKQLSSLRLVVFGHIHEAYGQEDYDGVTYVNASSLNRRYEPVNEPVVIDL